MPMPTRLDRNTRNLAERLLAVGDGAPPLGEKVRILEFLRSTDPATGQRLDRELLAQNENMQKALREAQANIEQCRQLLEKMTTPSWLVGVFIAPVRLGGGIKSNWPGQARSSSVRPRPLMKPGGSSTISRHVPILTRSASIS